MSSYIYLVRHGETDLNNSGVYYGRLDPEINEKGMRQCESLKSSLKNIDFNAVVASPLKRALKSATIISGCEDKDIIVEPQLREIDFGLWEGLHYKEVMQKYPEDWANWGQHWIDYTIPEGESFRVFYSRVENCIKNIINNNQENKILVVAHEGSLKAIALTLLNMPIEAYWNFTFEFGHFSMFEVKDGFAILRKINCI